MQHHNPLDNVEDVLRDNNWVFTRTNDETLQLEVRGSSCDYNMMFFWQDSLNALQLVCMYDMTLSDQNMQHAFCAINSINSSLMIGHFELDTPSLRPVFRHNCFMTRDESPCIEDFVDLSLMQCEQSLPIFELLSNCDQVDDDIISFALMNTEGES